MRRQRTLFRLSRAHTVAKSQPDSKHKITRQRTVPNEIERHNQRFFGTFGDLYRRVIQSAPMDKTLHDMFVLGLPIAEKMLRPIVVYVFLIVGLRLAGKR